MESTTSAMSLSLLARNVYGVCFTRRDSRELLEGELAQAREKFFSGGRKALRVGKSQVVRDFAGKLRGKLSRRGFYWKKTAGKVALEEAFQQRGGYLLLTRDFRGIIISRVFLDKSLLWTKSEYYEPWDAQNPRVLFKPVDADDRIERFDWDAPRKRYRSTMLFPVPYLEGTARQSLVNAQLGEPELLVSTGEGLFCYCPQQEAQARKKALDDLKDGTVVMLPAWEVKEGAIAGEEPEVTFTSLEAYATIEAPAETPAAEGPVEAPASQTEEAAPEEAAPAPQAGEKAPEAAPAEPPLPEDPEDRAILRAARQTAAPAETAPPAPSASYQGELRQGVPWGRGRTQRAGGLTEYEGQFKDGKREGFGAAYYKDGDLSYAGSWKEGKKEGLGVSFRDGDHALHVANWKEGKPQDVVALYDKEGNLRYGGRIEEGKKQGAGVSLCAQDGTVFVGQWKNGEPTGLGAAFDRDGCLLYNGGWKDGKRHGHGTEFDPSGAIVFDGQWKDGKYYNGILYQKLERQQPEEEPSGGELPDWQDVH